ncbi:unnamed protein product (macronuclear) [Paramecium tetraurelia]|uniref:Uncharacterized protein n=1 Tax=Paramecium tetraurelia TaxID=5888 RepID=A0DFL8_PARTE|nr:uncharacterized protein GSPATT00016648001 [Paramecium tetraurelia]CAK81835.1 unnamed protein product [Paramecium tetraurelia]|eukprot:XP_001449232.1 hypothetical protein (macronuclear) [Paramecium tetraurelia strain d4-2]
MKLARLFRFSTVKFPYNFKGVKPIHDASIEDYLNTIFGSNLSEGFLLAYQNLLESLTSSDYEEFIHENCDKNISKALIEGMKQMEKSGQKLKLAYNDKCKTNVMYGNSTLHFSCDHNQDLLDQKPDFVQGQGSKKAKMYKSGIDFKTMTVQRGIIEIAIYIRSPLFLSISGQEKYEEAYHRVDFRTHSISKFSFIDAKILTEQIMQLQKEKSAQAEAQIIIDSLGKDFTWKILNIDEYFK